MNDSNSEPVEISTLMGPGEWTRGTLTELLGSYQHQLWEMGAPVNEIEASVETRDDGSAQVNVSWRRSGINTLAATGPNRLDAAEGSAIDAPPTNRAAAGLAGNDAVGARNK